MAVFSHEQGRKYKNAEKSNIERYETVYFHIVGLKTLAVWFITVFSELFGNAEGFHMMAVIFFQIM